MKMEIRPGEMNLGAETEKTLLTMKFNNNELTAREYAKCYDEIRNKYNEGNHRAKSKGLLQK